jgi:hypothetical protein
VKAPPAITAEFIFRDRPVVIAVLAVHNGVIEAVVAGLAPEPGLKQNVGEFHRAHSALTRPAASLNFASACARA